MIFSIRSCFALLFFLCLTLDAASAETPREVVDLNPGWRFIRQDVPQAEQVSFDDSAWQPIHLPHTWNNFDGQDGGNNYYRGVGWYRLRLKTDPAWVGKAVYLKFDAASINTDVFVNGKPAGTHAGSFGAFCFDITGLLNHDGDNAIAVKVSNARDQKVAPLMGDFTVFGGIYRGVHLIVTDPLSISPIDDASSGVYVRQDKVDANTASLTITTMIRNAGAQNKSPSVNCELLDRSGGVVVSVKASVKVKHQIELQKQLNALAHQLDPTRLTTEATAVAPGRPQDDITDVVAFNLYYGWYGGRPDELAGELDRTHKIYPHRGVGMSEFGAGGAVSQHEANVKQPGPFGKWHPEEWQCVVHEAAWAALKPRQWVWCSFIWAGHDFAVDLRKDGETLGRNDKGMVTYDGKTKKDVFYFYKANWSTDPFVYITERRFTPRPVADAPVKIYSNCDTVELIMNGKSLGTRTGSDIHVFIWDKVQLHPGENQLLATATREGKMYQDRCVIVLDTNAVDGALDGRPPATQPAK